MQELIRIKHSSSKEKNYIFQINDHIKGGMSTNVNLAYLLFLNGKLVEISVYFHFIWHWYKMRQKNKKSLNYFFLELFLWICETMEGFETWHKEYLTWIVCIWNDVKSTWHELYVYTMIWRVPDMNYMYIQWYEEYLTWTICICNDMMGTLHELYVYVMIWRVPDNELYVYVIIWRVPDMNCMYM